MRTFIIGLYSVATRRAGRHAFRIALHRNKIWFSLDQSLQHAAASPSFKCSRGDLLGVVYAHCDRYGLLPAPIPKRKQPPLPTPPSSWPMFNLCLSVCLCLASFWAKTIMQYFSLDPIGATTSLIFLGFKLQWVSFIQLVRLSGRQKRWLKSIGLWVIIKLCYNLYSPDEPLKMLDPLWPH